MKSLVRYFHAASGLPVRSTWLDTIKASNFASWPGLTYQDAAKYCPLSDETLKGHMSQTRHNVCSTKPKPPTSAKLQALPASPLDHPAEGTNDVHSWYNPISKLYSDDTGSFPFRLRSGNRYVMEIL